MNTHYNSVGGFKPFSNVGELLEVQFTVKHEQDIDCGGRYVKIFDCKLDQKDMHGENPSEIMFGPDICGPGTKKVHVIFSYKGKNHLIKKDIHCEDDVYTHLYTLVVKLDNSYEVLIDNEKVESGECEADWDFLSPKKIKDPVPDAAKPEDWDDEMDGKWEPLMIDNPDYKGVWAPKQIGNPDYKGPWVHPETANPEYTHDANLYKREELCVVGVDLWQVKSGTIFDNFFFGNDSRMPRNAEKPSRRG
ncbi:unnamed protein product [Arctia plantaginis]|uniref:Calreticulin n=1 Tax=Arctia plantaginis TaxID=874455 RepID=A0A8S1AFL8_ARCPL|nr:unnamed protein product [Arctia plantaginis]